jgi:hypothetical protein
MIVLCKTCTASIIICAMELKITPEVREFYKQLARAGGHARARKYDHATLSKWAKLGGRPKKGVQDRNMVLTRRQSAK